MRLWRVLYTAMIISALLISLTACGKTKIEVQPEETAAPVVSKTENEEILETKQEFSEETAEEQQPAMENPEQVQEPEELPIAAIPAPSIPEFPGTGKPEYTNPITGEECSVDDFSKRPYAIAFSYAYAGVARAQTAVHYADMVLETYTEGYTTRLLAFYQSIDGIGQMGPLRSARLHFAKVAEAYGSIYTHVGMDPVYCKEWLSKNGIITVDYNLYYYGSDGDPYWFREENGLSSEHTLYSTSDRIILAANDLGIETATEDHEEWFAFTRDAENAAVSNGEPCSVLRSQISREHATTFCYDEGLRTYERLWNDDRIYDYKDGFTTTVKNVLILQTKVTMFDDDLHQNVSLDGGAGYYASEGKIIPICWKTDENGRFVITDESGQVVTLSVGKTWICLARRECEISWE